MNIPIVSAIKFRKFFLLTGLLENLEMVGPVVASSGVAIEKWVGSF